MQKVGVLRVERRARRMHEVMDALQVDRSVLARMDGGASYAKAQRRCLFCGTSDKCLRWLDQARKPGSKPAFCPNLGLFEACRRSDPQEKSA
jgi:hypothetical protein